MIALVPQHAEKIAPPRTLAVPFPLGRPLGVPGDAAFQQRVLDAALALLDHSGDATWQDFAEDAPATAPGEDPWVCPVTFAAPDAAGAPADATLAEMALLQPWYDKGLKARGRTLVGVSGMTVEAAVRYVASFLEDGEATAAGTDGRPAGEQIKLAAEDIKAFYNEALVAQPGSASVKDAEDWYWGESQAGKLIRAVRLACLEHEDGGVKLAASFLLVPGAQTYRDAD